jgi:hypothetical protein
MVSDRLMGAALNGLAELRDSRSQLSETSMSAEVNVGQFAKEQAL